MAISPLKMALKPSVQKKRCRSASETLKLSRLKTSSAEALRLLKGFEGLKGLGPEGISPRLLDRCADKYLVIVFSSKSGH